MEDIYSILDEISRPVGKVLATVVDVEGSAYKREGSSMVFFEDGSKVGLLSAGCLEEDLAIKAQDVLKKGTVAIVQYDMSDETDFSWGQGAGCNGIITILLETIDERLARDLRKVKKLLLSNIPVLTYKKIDERGEYLFLPYGGEPFGWWDGDFPDEFYDVKSGMIHNQSIFQHLYRPKPRLIVFGAGQDVCPLVTLAAKTGFSVTVCDWREEFCNQKQFPEAANCVLGFPNEIPKKIHFKTTDFFIIATHHFQRDQEILLNLITEKCRYIGVLGPRERTRRLLKGREIPGWIHSPAGLRIGATGPKEIAISIVAELIEAWRKTTQEPFKKKWPARK